MSALSLILTLFVSAQSAGQAPARRADTRTWYQAYADGKRAIEQKNWQAAVDSLEASKRARAPKPGRRIPFYGDVYDDYIPDYYLGIAYLNLKQYAQADEAFALVRTSGQVGPKDREYAEFQRQTGAVAAGLREVQTLAQNPPPAAGNPPATAVNGLPAGPANNPTAAAVNPPVTVATPQAIPSIQQQPTVPPVTAGGLPVQQRPPSGVLGPGPQKVGNRQGNSTIRPSGNVVVQPRAEEAAIRAYLSGQYDQAAALLSNSVAGAGATPRAFFYLACSRTALAILGQGGNADLDEAKSLIARAGNPAQFAEDRRYVSPRVLKMLGLNP